MNLQELDDLFEGSLVPLQDQICGVYFLSDENDEIVYVREVLE